MKQNEVIAKRCSVRDREIYLDLNDGTVFHFPAEKFPLLANASDALLSKVKLAIGGRALRWEGLDEDIQVSSIFAGNFPKQRAS